MRPSPWTPTERTSASSTTGHLPDVAVEAGAGELLAGDRVGLAQDVEPLAGDLADDPDAQAGAGERLAPDDLGRQAELLADQADLVLEQRAQRLDELELEVVGQAADVVVGLDVGGAGAAAGLDHVGVERALHEERDLVAASSAASAPKTSASAASKTRMNSRPMILRFSSGSLTPASASRNCFCGVDDVQVDAGGGDEVALDLLGLALAQQPVVDEDAGQPVADRALHDGRGDRGVDAAGERRRSPGRVADLLADPLDLLLDDVDHRPGLAAAGDVVQEVLEHLLAVLGVQHLGVPLDAGQAAARRPRRPRPGSPSVEASTSKPAGAAVTESPWDIQTVCSAGHVGEQGAGLGDRDRGAAVLAGAGVGDLAAEALGHQLEAVAHAEDRDAGREDRRRRCRARPRRRPTTARRTG